MKKSIFLLPLLIWACSQPAPKEEVLGKPQPPPSASVEAKQVAAAEQAPFVSEIEFVKGQSTLTDNARTRIDKMLKEASRGGKIDEIKIISWADMEYPSVHTKTLPKDERELAKHRLTSIRKFVEGRAGKVSISEYNMAERPGMLGELFNTSNARIKEVLEVSGVPNTDTNIKSPSKASRSIVMAVLKE